MHARNYNTQLAAKKQRSCWYAELGKGALGALFPRKIAVIQIAHSCLLDLRNSQLKFSQIVRKRMVRSVSFLVEFHRANYTDLSQLLNLPTDN